MIHLIRVFAVCVGLYLPCCANAGWEILSPTEGSMVVVDAMVSEFWISGSGDLSPNLGVFEAQIWLVSDDGTWQTTLPLDLSPNWSCQTTVPGDGKYWAILIIKGGGAENMWSSFASTISFNVKHIGYPADPSPPGEPEVPFEPLGPDPVPES